MNSTGKKFHYTPPMCIKRHSQYGSSVEASLCTGFDYYGLCKLTYITCCVSCISSNGPQVCNNSRRPHNVHTIH